MIKLRDYQQRISAQAVNLLKEYHLCYLSMECRTGKTLTALACAQQYGAQSVLVITKKKAMASIMKDYEVLNPGYAIEVVNYESAHKLEKPVKKGKMYISKYDIVILDEAHSLGAFPKPGTRTKAVKELCDGLPIIYLSGTPSPESYSQLYHQFWCSSFSPWIKYPNFYKWSKNYVWISERQINGYTVRDYSNANKELIDEDVRHLFIDYSQEEAGFECNINEMFLTVPMDSDTLVFLETIRRDRVLYIGDNSIVADTPAKLMSKMHQLSSGTVISEEGTHLVTDKSKAEYLKMAFSGKKLAIFYVYQSEADLLHEQFPNWTDSPEEFQQSNDKVFICQVRRAREGVRLDTADALIFFNLEYSYLSYEQGRNRLVSKERETPANVYFLLSDCGIESDIVEAVKNKTDFTYSWYKRKHKHSLF